MLGKRMLKVTGGQLPATRASCASFPASEWGMLISGILKSKVGLQPQYNDYVTVFDTRSWTAAPPFWRRCGISGKVKQTNMEKKHNHCLVESLPLANHYTIVVSSIDVSPIDGSLSINGKRSPGKCLSFCIILLIFCPDWLQLVVKSRLCIAPFLS